MNSRATMKRLGATALIMAGSMMSGSLIANAQQSATPPAGSTATQNTDTGAEGETPIFGTPLLQPDVDFTQAQKTALAGQSNAVVTNINLNGDDGVLTYSVTLDKGLEVDIDATTGAVVESEKGSNEDADNDNHENADDDESGDDHKESEDRDDSGDHEASEDGGNDEAADS